ncbi:hypothetical protein Tco_0388895 [Tanacetum coccineum]
MARNEDPRESFDELMDTPLNFSAFVMNRLNVDSLTPELLAGPTFELMKGTCKSLVKVEYFLEEFYKATTKQLDWINPEGKQYPHDLRKPLPLIPNSQVTKTKAADYGHIKWIEDLVPNIMWSPVLVDYDKHALLGISHWGRKRQQFYVFTVNRESARDVYSKRRIIAVTKLEIVEWQNYKHLDWIIVRRDDGKLYKFKEGDLKRLRIQDIKDMLLLLVQGKLTNLTVEERLAFNNKDKKNRLMRIDELHKFSDGTLDDVRTALNDRLKGIRMQYLLQTIWRQRDKENARAMIQVIEKKLKTRRIMRSLEKFVGGRPYEAGNPIKEILLKLNLPDHKSILTDWKVTPTKHRKLKDGGKGWQSLQDGKTRLCLVNDLKVFKESHSRQDEEQAQDLKSMITT